MHEESELTAASLIKRFRESKPMSREEREQARNSMGVKARMWWEETDPSSSTSKNKIAKLSVNDYDDGEEPRTSYRGAEPIAQSASTGYVRDLLTDQRRSNSAGRDRPSNAGALMDRLDASIYRSRPLGDSMEVDHMIEQEIRNLEKDIKRKEKETMSRLHLNSYSPMKGLDRSVEIEGIDSKRHRETKSGGLGRLSQSAEMFRNSIDTLGSTGVLGLMRTELKLDGIKDKAAEDEANKKRENESLAFEVVQKNLEELLKNMQENMPKNASDDIGISNITSKLATEMTLFIAPYDEAAAEEKRREEERRKRDEEMKELGRKEELERRLLEIDIPLIHPLEYLNVWDGAVLPPQQQQFNSSSHPQSSNLQSTSRAAVAPSDGTASDAHVESGSTNNLAIDVSNESNELNHHRVTFSSPLAMTSSGHPTPRSAAEQQSNFQEQQSVPVLPASVHGYRSGSGYIPSMTVMQRAVDNELFNADETFLQMRALRTNLGMRLRKLDAMYDSVMPPRVLGTAPEFGPNRMVPVPMSSPVERLYPPGSKNWGREVYEMEAEAQRNYNCDPRTVWNPYPELVHTNILGTAKGIESVLNSTIDTLNKRLPEKKPSAFASRLADHATGFAALAAGASTPRATPPAASASTQAPTPASAPGASSRQPTPTPLIASANASVSSSHAEADSKAMNSTPIVPAINLQSAIKKEGNSDLSLSVSFESTKKTATEPHPLSLSKDSDLSVSSSIDMRSTPEPKTTTATAVASTPAAPSTSQPVKPLAIAASSGASSALSLFARLSANRNNPQNDIEYIDQVLGAGNESNIPATSRFDKFIRPKGGASSANPFTAASTPRPGAAAGATPVTGAATATPRPSANATPRSVAFEEKDSTAMPAPTLVDPLRELRQQRVYQNVLYRAGSHVDPGVQQVHPQGRAVSYVSPAVSNNNIPTSSAPPLSATIGFSQNESPAASQMSSPNTGYNPSYRSPISGTNENLVPNFSQPAKAIGKTGRDATAESLQQAVQIAKLGNPPRRPPEGASLMFMKESRHSSKAELKVEYTHTQVPAQSQPRWEAPANVANSGLNVPPSHANITEKEIFLRKMQSLRQNIRM